MLKKWLRKNIYKPFVVEKFLMVVVLVASAAARKTTADTKDILYSEKPGT